MRAALASLLFVREAPLLAPVLRIALCTYLVAWRAHAELDAFTRAQRKPAALLHAPLFDALGLDWPAGAAVVDALPAVFLVCCALGALGILTRLALLGAFLAWLPMGTVASGFGFFNHAPTLPAQLLLALAVVPGAAACSVDRLALARMRGQPVEWAPPAPRFGDLILLLVVAGGYCASGVAKLRWGAAGWLDGSTLAFYLERRGQLWYGPAAVDAASAWRDGFGIAGYTYLSSGGGAVLAKLGPVPLALSWLTLALELSAPAALLSAPRVRVAWCAGAVAFHIGIAALVGPAFVPWLVVVAVVAAVAGVSLVGVRRAR